MTSFSIRRRHVEQRQIKNATGKPMVSREKNLGFK